MSELELVKAFQSISNRFLDYLFFALSFFGTEVFFIAIALALYWCVSKKDGYRFINVYFAGQIFVGLFKSLFKRARPYRVGARAILEKTEGYSFPSGHSATAANITTQLAILTKRSIKSDDKSPFYKSILAGAFLTVLVAASRIYLGQHYLSDVIFGAAWGVFSAVLFTYAYGFLRDKEENIVWVVLPASVIALVFTVILRGNQDYVKMAGAYGAVALGYYLEKKYIGYNVKSGGISKQIAKLLIGIAVVLVLKEGLKAGITALSVGVRATLILDFFRYFLVGITGALFMPQLFKKLNL